jgi:hypothetical protein
MVSGTTMGHGYFQSQAGCDEVISAVPYISGFTFCIALTDLFFSFSIGQNFGGNKIWAEIMLTHFYDFWAQKLTKKHNFWGQKQ